MSAELTLIQKFNEAKKRLADANLKKSGKNTYSKYDYFELGDFLPTIIKAEHDLNFLNHVTFPIADGIEYAQLTVYDGTSDKTLSFSTKTAEVEMKGMVPIQGIGAKQTYMRRYLYVLAYEISEHDAVDEGGVSDGKPQKQEPDKPQTPVKQPTVPVDEKKGYINNILTLVYPDRTSTAWGKPNGLYYEPYVKAMKEHSAKIPTELPLDVLKKLLTEMTDMVQECIK